MKKLSILVVALALGLTGCSLSGNSTASNSTDTTSQVATYSLADVALHNTKQDCWMAIEGKVYNVTDFIPSHPGGDVIVQGCGKDATSLFNGRPGEGTPHPQSARAQLKSYFIGELKS